MRILTELDLEDANLHGVRVLVLPNVACMSDRAAEVVRRFVRSGGGLIATFETSLYDADYRKRPDFALADLFRARYLGTNAVAQRTENLYLTLDADHPITDDPLIKAKQNTAWLSPGNPPDKGPLALIASATEVRALGGGQTISTYNVNLPAEKARERHPAIVVSQYGKGRRGLLRRLGGQGDVLLPRHLHAADARQRGPLGRARGPAAGGGRWPADPHGDLPPAARAEADDRPLAQPGQLLGHPLDLSEACALPEELNKQWGFPNQSELRGTWPVREEVIPLGGIRVICRVPGVKKATLQPGSMELPIARTADGVLVTVPSVGMHAMVIFE